MKKYLKKLVFLMAVCFAGSLLMIWMNGERRLLENVQFAPRINVGSEPKMLKAENEEVLPKAEHALILYSPGDEYSENLKSNTSLVLEQMRIDYEALELSRTESVSYHDYDMVIVASSKWESEIQDSMIRMTDYVEKGGKLLLEILPDDSGGQLAGIYRKLGILEYGEFATFNGMEFCEELIPGIQGMRFQGEGFEDVCLSVALEEDAKVYALAQYEDHEIPYIWSYGCGEGTVVCFNGTAVTGEFWKGVITGCVVSLHDSVMYPVVNASCIFIDDFPSPQYESTSDIVRKDYNRSVKEFYRDIWWPDMQRLAERYGDIYTCLFVATYNDIVDPNEFTYEGTSMEQYYGHSLLKAGHELGAHGYNHQSLTLEGGTPESFNYNPWANMEDMEASLEELEEIAVELFPSVTFESYVPPSNYLSEEGRRAIKTAYPEIKTISGLYAAEGEEGTVCVTNFDIGEDGIANFPRVSSGMLPSDYSRFMIVNAMGANGVFSHFIHPDDIFDEERGQNQSWETLYQSYGKLISWIHETYPFLRPMAAGDTADVLKVYQESEPYLEYHEDRIEGTIDRFYGEMYFFLKTEKTPQAVDNSCVIEKADAVNGEEYYIVTVKNAEFTIKLV